MLKFQAVLLLRENRGRGSINIGGAVDAKTRAHLLQILPGAYPAVLARAVIHVRRRRWFAKRYSSQQEAAEELAQDAVLRTIEGQRTWDPATVPDLDYFLSGVMRSILSAARKSPAFLTTPLSTIALDHDGDGGTPGDEALGVLDDRARGVKDPEKRLLDEESYTEVLDRALDAAADDATAEKVVNAVADGCEKVKEIEEATGLSAKLVYAATRKIRDRVRKAGKR